MLGKVLGEGTRVGPMLLQTLALLFLAASQALLAPQLGRRGARSSRRFLADGVEQTVAFLNNQGKLTRALALCDATLKDDMDGANFWSAGNFVVNEVRCEGVRPEGLQLLVDCTVKGKPQLRKVSLPFPYPVTDETVLK